MIYWGIEKWDTYWPFKDTTTIIQMSADPNSLQNPVSELLSPMKGLLLATKKDKILWKVEKIGRDDLKLEIFFILLYELLVIFNHICFPF